jgi:hypothetical protein
MPAHGGGANKGARQRRKIVDLKRFGRPRAAGKSFKKMRATPPIYLTYFPAARSRPNPFKFVIFRPNLPPLVSVITMSRHMSV